VAPPPRYMQMVAASRDEASLAVRLYNDPAEIRSFEGFIVHMHLAWLYLLHAELTRSEIDFRYWQRHGRSKRLEKVDGEPKRWELIRCVQERWPDVRDPVRANLIFFIGLRNKIEHRYARQQESLTAALGGQVQALLLNYEEELTSKFGVESSLATRLRFPVFVGSFTSEGEQTLRRLRRRLPGVTMMRNDSGCAMVPARTTASSASTAAVNSVGGTGTSQRRGSETIPGRLPAPTCRASSRLTVGIGARARARSTRSLRSC